MQSLQYLQGRRFCVVFVKILDPARERFQIQCFRGRADVSGGRLNVVAANGSLFTVPGSALGNIAPSDGSRVLRDAEYFVMVQAERDVEFVAPGDDYWPDDD